MTKRILSICILSISLVLLSAACGGGGDDPTATPKLAPTKAPAVAPTDTPATSSGNVGAGTPIFVEMTSNPYKYSTSEFSLNLGETYSLTLVADAEFHTFSVSELWGDIYVNPNETVKQDITPGAAGTFKLYCIPHETTGMVGEVTVS